jgi:hypothetical protein
LGLFGFLPQFGISLDQPIFGFLTVGTLLALGQFWIAYSLWKRRLR